MTESKDEIKDEYRYKSFSLINKHYNADNYQLPIFQRPGDLIRIKEIAEYIKDNITNKIFSLDVSRMLLFLIARMISAIKNLLSIF